MIGAAHPGFTHLQTGTAEADWRRADLEGLPVLDAEAPEISFGPGTVLLVGAAHPDDECLGAAGLIVTALAAGADVMVLLCTRGEASHPESPSVSAEQLAGTRRAEFDAALRELRSGAGRIAGTVGVRPGRAEAVELGLRDGSLSDSVAEIAAAADKLIRDSDRKRVIVAAPYRRDGHPDHAAVGEAWHAQRSTRARSCSSSRSGSGIGQSRTSTPNGDTGSDCLSRPELLGASPTRSERTRHRSSHSQMPRATSRYLDSISSSTSSETSRSSE